jgi:hypothetical protein
LKLTHKDLKGLKVKTVNAKDKRDMQYSPKMKVSVGVTTGVKCVGTFEFKNIRSRLGQVGNLGVIAHWSVCTASTKGEVRLKKNRASVVAVAMEVLIENYPRVKQRKELEYILWSKLNSIHPDALVNGVSLLGLKLEPLE